MDIWTKEKRSSVMARILSKNTKPELVVRRILTKNSFRYRLHDNKLPGKPDIVLRKYGAVIFVHGCFWHLHKGCPNARMPKTRLKYWRAKLVNNAERDIQHRKELKKLGWKILCLWECEIEKRPEVIIHKIQGCLNRTPIAQKKQKMHVSAKTLRAASPHTAGPAS